MDETVISCSGDDHDASNGSFQWFSLQLFRDFTDTGCGLHETRVGVVFGGDSVNFFEYTIYVDKVTEALVEEAGRA